MFRDRKAAGEELAQVLKVESILDPIIIGVPRGGVIVAEPIAKVLKARIDIVISRKIGSPHNPEVAVGAVSPDGQVKYDERICQVLGVEKAVLDKQTIKAQEEIHRRTTAYGRTPEAFKFKNKSIILVDDGIATGFTLFATIDYLRRQEPKEIVLAVPVCPADLIPSLSGVVDKFYCLSKPENFYAVGQFYEDFGEVSDEEVIQVLREFN